MSDGGSWVFEPPLVERGTGAAVLIQAIDHQQETC
jgi:hypothetical protein